MSRTFLRHGALGALLLPALVLGACAKKDAAEDTAAADSAAAAPATDAAAPATEPAAAAPAVTDAQIAAIVVAANTVDIAAGELAKEKGADPQVKEFGQRMVTDHTGVNRSAGDLAGRLKLAPEENETSRGLTAQGDSVRARLQGLSGKEFDRAYMANEVTYHQTVLDAIDKTLIPSARNAELKALLEGVRPAIAAHLDHARRIQAALEGA